MEAAVASLPLSFLIVAILVVNEFPDFESDSLSGKRNLVVRLGRRKARYGLLAIALFAFASVIAGVIDRLHAASFAHRAPWRHPGFARLSSGHESL